MSACKRMLYVWISWLLSQASPAYAVTDILSSNDVGLSTRLKISESRPYLVCSISNSSDRPLKWLKQSGHYGFSAKLYHGNNPVKPQAGWNWSNTTGSASYRTIDPGSSLEYQLDLGSAFGLTDVDSLKKHKLVIVWTSGPHGGLPDGVSLEVPLAELAATKIDRSDSMIERPSPEDSILLIGNGATNAGNISIITEERIQFGWIVGVLLIAAVGFLLFRRIIRRVW